MRLPTKLLVIVGLALATSACTLMPQRINPNYAKVIATPADEVKRDEILDNWFTCDECVSGQLRRVQEYGNAVIDQLNDARMGNVPDLGDKLDVFEAKCLRVNGRLAARGLTPPETCEQYRARAEMSLRRRYALRGFEALLAIRTVDTCNLIGADRCTGTDPFPPIDFRWSTDRGALVWGVVP